MRESACEARSFLRNERKERRNFPRYARNDKPVCKKLLRIETRRRAHPVLGLRLTQAPPERSGRLEQPRKTSRIPCRLPQNTFPKATGAHRICGVNSTIRQYDPH